MTGIRADNPVWEGYLADPFAFRARGRWYAVGTGAAGASDSASGRENGIAPDEHVLPLLVSDDFTHWRYVREALKRPDHRLGGEFWAPSVAEHEGRFHLYYSVGPGHQLRVAIAADPEGPYVDHGPLLPAGTLPFAIDSHPVRDHDGTWWLFYARDFTDRAGGAHAGTALVMDRLVDMVRLAGEERTVLRAMHPWTLFQAQRSMYGQVWDWHTVEGPCVVAHGGRWWCLYSGACYGNDSYGVDYVVADRLTGPWSDAGGEQGPRVLRTLPGRVIGPGHNSIVIGPDGEMHIVYHAWNQALTVRQMCIDRLDWTADGPRCTPTVG